MMLSNVKTFKGANVFMSRNLVAPEVFDTLLDALKVYGADVFLCCDPSRNGPNDFHVISSMDHEKFEDLRAKNCTLLGPQCVVACAKEHRPLPKQGFTCCLAMDDVKILASGFDVDEKNKIEKLVTAMGGQVLTKASLDVSFVIVKNVLAAKYKWALHILKKPIVSIDWLFQCWNEHRVVSHEVYRVLPFSGLMICVSRIPPEERKDIEKVITQNGGKYSPELTKKCTHLICPAPEGDKYKVARRWGHIHIVTRKWLDQSVVRKACLDEESYPVQGGSISSIKTGKSSFVSDYRQDKSSEISMLVPSSTVATPSLSTFPAPADPDLEATLSQNMSSMFSDPAVFLKAEEKIEPATTHETDLDDATANDSQSEDDGLYLSECRISLVGFETSVLCKLVDMVRRGGGSRYKMYNDRLLTHLVVGAPSEIEKKELRALAASGVIHVVRTTWLEDCDRQRKEVPVLRHHLAYDLLIPKESLGSIKRSDGGKVGINQAKVSSFKPGNNSDVELAISNSGYQELVEKKKEEKSETNLTKETSLQVASRLSQLKKNYTRSNRQKSEKQTQLEKKQHDFSDQMIQNKKSTGVFDGKRFCFSKSFPEDRRAEIVEWISQGGGELLDDHVTQNVDFTIECHGVQTKPSCFTQTAVSSHWVRSCLEDGRLLVVSDHVIYSPLTCQIPLPGFKNYKFCVSQYEEKDRLLLRNLCYVLGAKFVEKLTKKVTHLLCKFANGPKYEAACKWGIHSITSEWIYECVRQNEAVPLDPFRPKEVTSQDLEAGVCTVTQFPTQSVQMMSVGCPSEVRSHSHDLNNTANETSGSLIASSREEAQQSVRYFKKTRLLDDKDQREMFSFRKKDTVSSRAALDESMSKVKSTGGNNLKENGESSHGVPDVAAAIEDLLEQTSKIRDQKSPERREADKRPFPSPMLSEDQGGSLPVIGLSKNWLNRAGKRDESSNPSKDIRAGIYDGFSETQTESQVVGYEEDLSGRQKLIDRVRTRSGSIN